MDMVLPTSGWKGLASGARRRAFSAADSRSSDRCSAPENENIVSKSRPFMLEQSKEVEEAKRRAAQKAAPGLPKAGIFVSANIALRVYFPELLSPLNAAAAG